MSDDPRIVKKPWGESQRLFATPQIIVDVIRFEERGYSSIHHHARMHNAFFLLEGELTVEEFDNRGGVAKRTRMVAGSQHVVPAGIAHRFIAESDGAAHELYWSADGEPIDASDIFRTSPNGKRRAPVL